MLLSIDVCAVIFWTIPNLRYPEALAYQLARGIIHRFSHGLARIYGAREGADMLTMSCCALVVLEALCNVD
jgi:hypothetical protein